MPPNTSQIKLLGEAAELGLKALGPEAVALLERSSVAAARRLLTECGWEALVKEAGGQIRSPAQLTRALRKLTERVCDTGAELAIARRTVSEQTTAELVGSLCTGVKSNLDYRFFANKNLGVVGESLTQTVGQANNKFGFPAPSRVEFSFDFFYGVGQPGSAYYQGTGIIYIDATVANRAFREARAIYEGVHMSGRAGAEFFKSIAHENTHLLQDTLKIRRYVNLNPQSGVSDVVERFSEQKFRAASEQFVERVIEGNRGRVLTPIENARADILLAADANNRAFFASRDRLIESGVLQLKPHLPSDSFTAARRFEQFWNKFPKTEIPSTLKPDWQFLNTRLAAGKISEAEAGKRFLSSARTAFENGTAEWNALYRQYKKLPHEEEAFAVGRLARRLFLQKP